ncbi:MAG: hypothetical protein VX641_07825 [Planctomycetota bacterium]|nr:hypothetical protein [Planctomycetota bacterium]
MLKTLTTAVVSLCIAGSAAADLINPLEPSWRGDANTAFAQWDSFTSAAGGPNAPTEGSGYNLYNFNDGAILTGGGNMYASSNSLNIHVYPAAAPLFNLQQAVVNISFLGNPIDVDNVQAFVGEPGSGEYFTMESQFRGGDPTSLFAPKTYAFTVDLSGAARGFQGLSFFFESLDENSSLDAISIDVLGSAIPAPGALLGLGLLGVARRRKR